jgi:hypothetical protein
MKSRSIIALLVASNLVLAACVAWLWQERKLSFNAAPVPAAASLIASPLISTQVVTQIHTNAFQWAQLESEDYRTYIERLRRIGCPEQTIRDIIIADIDNLLAPRLASAFPRQKDLKYWHPVEQEFWNDQDQRQVKRLEREVDLEKREIIRELMGFDLVGERMKLQGQYDYYGRRLAFLDELKRGQTRDILEKYDTLEEELREKERDEGVPLDASELAQLWSLRRQRDQEISSLLSPQEFEQFELWLSPAANTVRNAVYGMEASEHEFLQLFALQKQFDQHWRPEELDLNDPSTRHQYEMARAGLELQIEAALGPERYAEYQRGQDPDFRILSAATTRYQLPAGTAQQIYEYKQIAQGELNHLFADPGLTQAQKNRAAQEVRIEIQNAVRELIGERAFNYYLHQGATDWIR